MIMAVATSTIMFNVGSNPARPIKKLKIPSLFTDFLLCRMEREVVIEIRVRVANPSSTR